MTKNRLVSIAIIIAAIGIVFALVYHIYNGNVADRLATDSLKVANDSLLHANDSITSKVDTLLIQKDSLISVIDTVKKK